MGKTIHGLVTHDHPAITGAGSLPCKYVIHAVGPIWGEGDEINKLEQTIIASLDLLQTTSNAFVAFPAISTGIFGFPFDLAAQLFSSSD